VVEEHYITSRAHRSFDARGSLAAGLVAGRRSRATLHNEDEIVRLDVRVATQ